MIPVEFASSGSLLGGYFFPAHGDAAIATILFLQGFPGIEGDELVCERLAQEGVHVLTFNYRGTFQSEGYFSFSNALADIGAALQFLAEPENLKTYRIDPARIVLGGWSFGSGIVPAGAILHPEIKRIFAISGRDFSKEARKISQDPLYAEEVRRNLEGIRAPKGPVLYRDDMLSDLVENRDAFEIEKLAPLLKDREILLIGAQEDDVAPLEDYIIPFHRALKEQGAAVRLETFQDNHEFSESREQLVQVIWNWLSEGKWVQR